MWSRPTLNVETLFSHFLMLSIFSKGNCRKFSIFAALTIQARVQNYHKPNCCQCWTMRDHSVRPPLSDFGGPRPLHVLKWSTRTCMLLASSASVCKSTKGQLTNFCRSLLSNFLFLRNALLAKTFGTLFEFETK